ncbi:hypothetical protein Hypma_011566 [Hypsizygus marmoreus]|uniref:Uncharacterized protein n=1 Tax=Hypsizygus marmoreus TaxID=39966 RepID=A0A369JFU7_HYPMA|nr:hypothetical protein Hypma_011566 [Hypsizygus marmoreus]
MGRDLTTIPNPRSRSLERSLEYVVSSSENKTRSRSASRHSNRQQSIASIPRRPHPTPPVPGSSRASHLSSSSYTTDASSSGSSIHDRYKFGPGYSSSRTSLDDKGKAPTSSRSSLEGNVKHDIILYLERPEFVDFDTGKDESKSNSAGDGSAIWNRVATVASTLTISVSKAWAASIASQAGEETPVGQESRLIRAMKAYHLDKARDPTDLPTWLFDERERRRPTNIRRPSTPHTATSETASLRTPRNVYDVQVPIASSRPTAVSGNQGLPRKATDRLKAMRDAKRSAPGSGFVPRHSTVETTENKSQHNDNPKGITRPRVAMGLPSGPRRVRE